MARGKSGERSIGAKKRASGGSNAITSSNVPRVTSAEIAHYFVAKVLSDIVRSVASIGYPTVFAIEIPFHAFDDEIAAALNEALAERGESYSVDSSDGKLSSNVLLGETLGSQAEDFVVHCLNAGHNVYLVCRKVSRLPAGIRGLIEYTHSIQRLDRRAFIALCSHCYDISIFLPTARSHWTLFVEPRDLLNMATYVMPH